MSPGPLLNAKQAGELLNVPATWVVDEARRDRIPHVRLGRYVRFDREALLDWRERRQRGPVGRRRRVDPVSDGYAHADNDE
jgi:excisionase family DNA binding protein